MNQRQLHLPRIKPIPVGGNTKKWSSRIIDALHNNMLA